MNAKKLALLIQEACEEKKGVEPLIMDVRKLTNVADYFILVHGSSDRHVRTIADNVIEQVQKAGIKPYHVEGLNSAKWILLDYGTVIVHVFYYEARKFYHLERLWGDAKIIKEKPLFA